MSLQVGVGIKEYAGTDSCDQQGEKQGKSVQFKIQIDPQCRNPGG